MITTAEDIKKLGKIMTVWAHPDDETFCAGGLLAAAIENGQEVICITATKGEAGVYDTKRWPAEQIGEIRESELDEALKILGIKTHHWLGFRDGECQKSNTDEAAAKVKKLIQQYQPDTILTFGPDGLTGHTDHASVSKWTSLACADLKNKPEIYHFTETHKQHERYFKEMDEKLNIYFNIDKPVLRDQTECDIYFKLPDNFCDKKCRALAAMPSQTNAMVQQFGMDYLLKAFGVESFVKA